MQLEQSLEIEKPNFGLIMEGRLSTETAIGEM
jgi:hypothetical protein